MLQADTASLALFVTGRTRVFTITNVGGQHVLDMAVTQAGALPSGTTMTSDCTDLAPAATCSVSITPGATPSAAPGDTQAIPVVLRIAGSNTDALDLTVHVLDYGSVYQGGYLFAIDDSTPETNSIGGKVLNLTGRAAPWLVDESGAALIATTDTKSRTDGQANTRAIVAYMAQQHPAVDAQLYPAGICDTSTEAGFPDWYLPAVCEFSYDFDGSNRLSTCGTASSPALQNVQSALLDTSTPLVMQQINSNQWWSSTEHGLSPTSNAFHYIPGTDVWLSNKGLTRSVACARVLTP